MDKHYPGSIRTLKELHKLKTDDTIYVVWSKRHEGDSQYWITKYVVIRQQEFKERLEVAYTEDGGMTHIRYDNKGFSDYHGPKGQGRAGRIFTNYFHAWACLQRLKSDQQAGHTAVP